MILPRKVGDVVLDHKGEGADQGGGAGPGGQLAVPEQGVLSDHFVIGLSPADECTGAWGGKHATARLDCIPFHRVLRGDLVTRSMSRTKFPHGEGREKMSGEG